MISALHITAALAVMLICSGCASQPSAAQPDKIAIETAIKATYAEITRAAESIDAEKIFSYVLENKQGALIQGGKIVLTRQDALDSYKQNSAGIEKVKYLFDQQCVTVISPESAVMVAQGRYEATTTDGRTFDSPFAQTVVFVLKDNQWKVLHSHTSSPDSR